jgi:hypothetical protein
MKRNGVRLTKLEDKLIGNRSDIFRLSDFEILERIEGLEFQRERKPTQKFLDIKKVADRTKPVFTPKVYQCLKEKQAERSAEIEAMNEQELHDHLKKLAVESDMDGTFVNHNKSKKETLC